VIVVVLIVVVVEVFVKVVLFVGFEGVGGCFVWWGGLVFDDIGELMVCGLFVVCFDFLMGL